MSQAERGLFEGIDQSMFTSPRNPVWRIVTPTTKEICAEFEQRLSEANSTIEDLRLIEREKTDQVIACNFARTELEQRLAEAERERDKFRLAAEEAFSLMDRARRILTNGNPTPENNWGMLDTKYLREKLTAPLPEQK